VVFSPAFQAWRYIDESFPIDGPLTDDEGRFELANVPLDGVTLDFSSDAIIPRGIGAESYKDDGTSSSSLAEFVGTHPESLEIQVERRAHVQLELVDPSGKPEFRLLDEAGKPVEMTVFMGTNRYFFQEVPCVEGRSHVVSTTERARWLVLLRDGKETQRVQVKLVPGETTHVKL